MKLTLLLLTSVALHAATCFPDTVHDSQPIPQSCYGSVMTATPFSTWSIFANDNKFNSPANDWDGNDLMATATVNATGDSATFVLLGGLSAHLDRMLVDNALLFTNQDPVGTLATVATAAWQRFNLALFDTVTGDTFKATPGNHNFVITCDSGCGGTPSVPEPSTLALLGAAGLVIYGRRRVA